MRVPAKARCIAYSKATQIWPILVKLKNAFANWPMESAEVGCQANLLHRQRDPNYRLD